MKRMLIHATQPDEVRVAITEGSQLIDLDIEVPGQEQKKANIYKGIISSIEPSLGAVFVNYGSERHGFLPLKEISREYFVTKDPEQLQSPDINKVLKIGQPLVVQVEKEERGTKGAALTTFISLAGSFLVLMPNNPRGGGISRRIEGEERDQLRQSISELEIPEGMSIIVRTAGVGKNKEELAWDLSVLLHYWEGIKQAATIKDGAYLIHQESDVIIRGIRDYLRQDIGEIIIDDESAYQRAHNYLNQIRPNYIEKLKLYQDSLPLFSRFQIEHQIESAYQREVRLPSGGSLAIDPTEALVAIDINSARATKGSNIEETALRTNLEAAEEIARQLRIRDIGGLVVIDFIDMTPVRNQREVETCLRNALRQDRARIQLGRISRFGLLEMSRQRLRSSLSKSSHITCPRCEGQGTIRGVESQALSVIHLIQEQASKAKHVHFQVQLPLDMATYITNEKRDALKEIERHCEVKITIIPNQFLESPHYQLKQVRCTPDQIEHSKGVASYKLIKNLKADQNTKKSNKPSAEPAINQFLSSSGSGTPKKPSSSGLIKRLWTKMFGSETTPPEPAKKTQKSNKRPAQKRQNQDRRKQPQKAAGQKKPVRKQRTDTAKNADKKEQKPQRSRRGSRGGQQRRGGQQNRPQKQAQKPVKPAGAQQQQQHKQERKPQQAPKKVIESEIPPYPPTDLEPPYLQNQPKKKPQPVKENDAPTTKKVKEEVTTKKVKEEVATTPTDKPPVDKE